MEPDELDTQLDELEVRVDRLRALYEQYFLGIEKLEPAVPRKDVDRRIWLLRRTQIRNTAKRFRLHNIIQRYNTFQQYWQRICREIENGTYTRHLLRAVKRLGEDEALTIAARRRFGRRPADGEVPPPVGAQGLAEVEAELTAELRRLSEPPSPPGEDDALLSALVPSAPPLLPLVSRPPLPPPLPISSRPLGPPPVAPRGSMPAPTQSRPPVRPGLPPLLPRPSLPGPPGSAKISVKGPIGVWIAPGDPMARPHAQTPPIPAAKPTSSAIGEGQLRELHARLMRARDQTGDQTRVSVDALAKSLDAAAARLRQQHGQHRRIEFEVVIKDGKAVVRPIVR